MPNVSSFGAQTDNSVVQGTVTDRAMVIPDIPPQGLMSVGPRVTPHFVKPSLWSALTTYHFFDAVHDAAGASYVAIKPEVPAGTELADEDYWFLWADPNSQFADLSELVKTYNARITQNTNDIATKAPINHASEETTYGVGNEVNYGHVRLAADDTPLTSDANAGIAATPKMVRDKLKKTAFGLKAFGAVENTDASAQMLEMIRSVGYISLDADYLIDTVILPNEPIIIIGNNHKLTALKKKQVLFSGATISEQGNNKLIYLENCVFDGGMTNPNDADYSKMALNSNRCDVVVIKNCEFKNFAEDGVYIGGVDRACIENCSFENIGTYLYQSTRNGFSCFSWHLAADGVSKAGNAGRLISITNNTFKDITDEGFRIDDFDLVEINNNSFDNIGQYAMEPTYDVTFSASEKVFNASNNRITNTGSTAISFDLVSHYDQSARKNFKVTLANNTFDGIANGNRYMKNGQPLSAKLHIICNFYVTNGKNELTIINNNINIDGYTPHEIAGFANYLTYIAACSKYTFEGNNVSIVNNSTEINASYMCLARAFKGNYTIDSNNIGVNGAIFTLLTAENECDVKLTNNNINANCQYISYFNGTKNVKITGNNIKCEPSQHVFLNQKVGNFMMQGNVINQSNNTSQHIIVSNLGTVENTNFMMVNNLINKAANIAYPTTGFNSSLIENNI